MRFFDMGIHTLFVVFTIFIFIPIVKTSRIHGHFKSDIEETIELKIKDGGRYKRGIQRFEIYPSTVDVELKSQNRQVNLTLVVNNAINSNAGVYTGMHGSAVLEVMPESKDVVFYQDVEHGAAVMLEFNDTHITDMIGTLYIGDEEYWLERRPISESVESDSTYHLLKSSTRDFMFSDFRINDKINDTLSWADLSKTEKLRRHKRAVTSYTVELLIVTDYSVYKFWYDKSKSSTQSEKDKDAMTSIRQFYAFAINAIDLRYKSLSGNTISLSVVFAGIFIADSVASSSWTETLGSDKAEAGTILDFFETWDQSTSGLPQHDHAMLFTRYDLKSSGSSSTVGLATVSGMCTPKSQSIVEDAFSFRMMGTAAHELGHGLGARHDGVAGNSCNEADGYLMAATGSVIEGLKSRNLWKFSPCSENYFETLINDLNNDGNNCLTTLSPNYDPTALAPFDKQKAGQVYSVDMQCQESLKSSASYLCRSLYTGGYDSICYNMYCAIEGSNKCQLEIPADATSCGNKKWCIAGSCVSSADAPAVPDNCPFGNIPGILSSVGKTCGDYISDNPNACYSSSVTVTCCETCNARYTGVPGCEYGDRFNACDVDSCPFYDENSRNVVCCGTCAEPTTTTTTTPTTTTTTPTTTTTTPTTTTTTPTTTTTTPTTTTTTTTTTPTTTTTTPTTTTTAPTTTTTTPTTTTTTPTTTTTTPTTTTTTPTTTTTTPTTTTTTPTTTTTTPTTTTTSPTTTTITPTTTPTTPTTTITTPTTTTKPTATPASTTSATKPTTTTTPATTTTTPTTTTTTPTTTTATTTSATKPTTTPATTTTTPTTTTTTPTTTIKPTTTTTLPTTTDPHTNTFKPTTTTLPTTTASPSTTTTLPTTTASPSTTSTTTSTVFSTTTIISQESTASETNVVPETTTQGIAITSEKLPVWVIPAAAGGGGFLFLLLIVITCCVCRKSKSEEASIDKVPKMVSPDKLGVVNKAYTENEHYYSQPNAVSDNSKPVIPAKYPPKHQQQQAPSAPRKKSETKPKNDSSIFKTNSSLRGHTNRAFLTHKETKHNDHKKDSATKTARQRSPSRYKHPSQRHSPTRSNSEHVYVEIADPYRTHYVEIKPRSHGEPSQKYHVPNRSPAKGGSTNQNYSRGTKDGNYTHLQYRPQDRLQGEYTELNKIKSTPGVKSKKV